MVCTYGNEVVYMVLQLSERNARYLPPFSLLSILLQVGN